MPVRPCGVCGVPAREGACPAHPRRRAARANAAQYRGLWPRIRNGVLMRDGHACRYCGQRATTADHVIPGLPAEYLLAVPALAVAACLPCNSSKRDLDLAYWVATNRAPAGARAVLEHLRPAIAAAEQWMRQQAPVFPRSTPTA